MMADRPILFSRPMVRALLRGQKTQTRRPLKLPQTPDHLGKWEASTVGGPGILDAEGNETPVYPCLWHTRNGALVVPRFCVGDRLWVKETWHAESWYDRHKAKDRPRIIAEFRQPHVWYDAGQCSYNGAWIGSVLDLDAQWSKGIKRVSIHMPRWASRLTLTVTDVRVERLQDISEADAEAEGCVWDSADGHDVWYVPSAQLPRNGATAPECYSVLWDSINGAGAWALNPWIVAITFDVREGNIDG